MHFIKGFDGLRALSITAVILTHLGVYDLMFDYDLNPRPAYLIHGITGVTLFFTISGFLITLLLLNERKVTGTVNIRNFYARRFLRLLPPLVILFAAIFWLTYTGKIYGTMSGLVMSIFYLYNYMPRAEFTRELTHTWTLGVEEQFYLIWPWALAFIRASRKLILIMLSVAAVCFVFRYILPELYHTTASGDELKLTDQFLPMRWFIPAAAPIMIGSLFGLLVHRNPGLINKQSTVILSAIVIIFLYLTPLWIPFSLFELASYFQAIGFGILITLIYSRQDSWLTLALNFKPLAFVGKISYGIYVYQGLFLCTGPSGVLWVQQFPQNVILTFFVAIASYYLIERPFLKLKDKFRVAD